MCMHYIIAIVFKKIFKICNPFCIKVEHEHKFLNLTYTGTVVFLISNPGGGGVVVCRATSLSSALHREHNVGLVPAPKSLHSYIQQMEDLAKV